MYTALLHSYVSPEWGTAGKIHKALEEMAAVGIEPDARACECALEALAVHPDSFVRTDVLDYMRERWWTPTPTAQCFIIAGLLRERCFELALERLENMLDEGVRIDAWLWDKAIWILLEFGEVEEAFYVLSLKRKTSNNVDAGLSSILWSQLLDVAGQRQIPEAVSMIWYSHVVTGYLRPTSGTCLNVLSVAARVGDVKLATDVFRVLAERNTVFNNHHYEALIQCYLVVHDLPAALSVVLIMQESSLKVTEEQLHPLYAYLRRGKERPMNAFMQLQDLGRSGRKIPTAAVNVCIAASVQLGDLPEAIELYKALKSVAKAGPTAATFNELFRGCYRGGRKELAMYLANEMVELDIQPDRLTYDRLILTCIHAGDIDDAISYFEEMRSEGMLPRRGTHEDLIERTLKARDARCVALLNWYKTAEYRVEARVASLHRLVSKHFEEGGERKNHVARDANVQEASEAMEGKRIGDTDSASKKEENAQAALQALQEEMGGTQTEAGAQKDGTGEVDDASAALHEASSEPRSQPESRTSRVPDYTKFHI
ncbi:hypothetical protein P171DRAFT_349062 [Karstenula rhodostoma CBS 690.94]|uniref:Pentatricopeptide repeat-containing protein-mitochondrial domain-containing protein n=1 Tax=Karstenula rhodostoma CBS 690.94 TaxID=1392251 RepID=A0A9P4PXH1_9PLEO|nr:hypothetical protein P171DRAFT_349062 [Karstenula rhodostoma CBS 690.94]